MINVTKSYLPTLEKYTKYIERIFQCNQLTNNGQFLKEFENRLKEYLNVDNLLVVSNGTIALQIAYKLLELKGEVITTPFSFIATTSSLVWEGLEPKFTDIESDTLNMNPNKIEKEISEKTSAILPVHVYGNPCNVEEIQRITEKNNLKLIYDGAHTFGVNYKNKSILSYGDITTISFHATKMFHSIEGGALVIKDTDLFHKAKTMINFGYNDSGVIERPGINAKMNEFQAAMGLCVLDDLDKIINKRKIIHEFYSKELNDYVGFPIFNKFANRNYVYFPIILKDENSVIGLIQELRKNEINSRRYFYPSLDMLSFTNSEKLLISNEISKRVLCLPIYDSLLKNDLKRICNIIKKNV